MMQELFGLWLPIIVSAVAVFMASALAWMVLPHHKADWKGISGEDAFLGNLGSLGIKPGQYMFPFCESGVQMKDPQFKKRWDAGPHGTLTIWSGPPNMGRNLTLTFIFYLVVGLFVAYLGAMALEPGERFIRVFRVTSVAAIIAYVFGMVPQAIWFGRPSRTLLMDVLDGLVYGSITGLIFGWLWP